MPYLLVNFGGPRDVAEIEEFLIELLTDQEVVRTRFPAFLHKWLFTRVAKKRSVRITPDYILIGGKSPIFEDTEKLAERVGQLLGETIFCFHRYLPKTHLSFLEQMHTLKDAQEIRIVPLFPQFSYATTGSIARWFEEHLPKSLFKKLSWVKSYPNHPLYVSALKSCLADFLGQKQLREEEIFLLSSAHGLPERFILTGDNYEKECRQTFEEIKREFPQAAHLLSFQSQFGKEKWITPYTSEVCDNIEKYIQGRKQVVILPLSFTSDHIETLYEIETLYVKQIQTKGIEAFRCPALNLRQDWVATIATLFQKGEFSPTSALLRKFHKSQKIK